MLRGSTAMKSMFIAQPIAVVRREDVPTRPPQEFTWQGRRYVVTRVEAMWHDAGFGALRYSPRWWQRRHRTYFQVTVESGELFEIYLERPRRQWFLYRQLIPED